MIKPGDILNKNTIASYYPNRIGYLYAKEEYDEGDDRPHLIFNLTPQEIESLFISCKLVYVMFERIEADDIQYYDVEIMSNFNEFKNNWSYNSEKNYWTSLLYE